MAQPIHWSLRVARHRQRGGHLGEENRIILVWNKGTSTTCQLFGQVDLIRHESP
jgi:hypothetical protein